MQILVITGRNHSKSNRGIDVIIEHLGEVGHNVFVYVYPVSFSNRLAVKQKKAKHIYAKYTPFNYYEKLMNKFPVFISRLIFKIIFKYTNTVNFSNYDLIVVESGYAVSLTDFIPMKSNLVYRQSDSLELILTKNKYLIECERKLISRSNITLIPNTKIINYYKKIGFKNLVLWENGFLKLEECNTENTVIFKNISCLYMGLYPIDLNLLEQLAEIHNDVDYHIVGPHKKNSKKNNIYFHGYMDYSKYINMLRSINFTILPIKNTQRLNYTGQTSKIYQFMDCKKPVITTNYGFISEFAKKTKNIYFCSNLEEFTRAICELKRNEFRYYEDLDLTNYYIENRKEELERILKDTVPYYG